MSFLDRFNPAATLAPAPPEQPVLPTQIERTGGRPILRRAVAAATRPVTWVTQGRPMLPEWDALSAVRRAYLSNVFVYRCVQLRAQALAGLPIRVGADPDKPEEHDPNAPLLKFLTRNPAVGARQLVVQSSAEYDVTGRFGWELDLDGRRRPVQAFPLTAAYLEPIPSVAERGKPAPTDYWAGFWYKVADGERPYRELAADQVFYAWRPSLHNWREPESILQAQRLNVSVAVMLDRYNYHFLLNDARPASVVVTQAFAEAGERDRFEADWNGRFGGPQGAGKPVFVEAELEDGEGPVDAKTWLEVKTLGLSQKDAQQAEIYQQELRSICVGFGIDLSLLGDTAARTFDNADQAHANFWELAMLPHMGELADHVNRRLAPLFGSNVMWFDTSRVKALQEPSKFAIPVLKDLVDTVVTVNEARAEVGLPPRDDKQFDQLAVERGEEQPVAPVVPLHAVPDDPDDEREDDQAEALTRTGQQSLERRANPDHSSGVMVALYPPPDLARALAVPGGLPPEELHVTLAYLGDLQELGALDPARLEKLRQLVAGWAATVRPLPWSLSGVGQFTAIDPPCTVALVDAPGLAAARQRLVDALQRAGFDVPADHGFTAHLTLTYDRVDAGVPTLDGLAFYAAALVVGTVRFDFPLLGTSSLGDRAAQQVETRVVDPAADRERRARLWTRANAQAGLLEDAWEQQLADFFAEQERVVLERLGQPRRGKQLLRADGKGIETRAFDHLFDLSYWTTRLRDLLGGLLRSATALGAGRVADQFPDENPLRPADAAAFVLGRANQLAGLVNQTTYDAIKTAMVEGIQAGEGVDRIGARIREVFAHAARTRAATIARTEVISASNGAAELAAGRMPASVVAGKEWLATPDHRTRHDHREMDGQIVPVGAAFMVGDPPVAMPYPGWPGAPPEQVINCRCALAFLAPEDLEGRAGMHVEVRRALAVLDLIADGIVTPAHLPRVLEVA